MSTRTSSTTTPVRRTGWRRLARLVVPAVALSIAGGAAVAPSARATLPPHTGFSCLAGVPSIGVRQDGRELAWTSSARLSCHYLSPVTTYDVQAKVKFALHPAETPLRFITSAFGPTRTASPLPLTPVNGASWSGNSVIVPLSCTHGQYYDVSAEAYARFRVHGRTTWSSWYPTGAYPSGVTFSIRRRLC